MTVKLSKGVIKEAQTTSARGDGSGLPARGKSAEDQWIYEREQEQREAAPDRGDGPG